MLLINGTVCHSDFLFKHSDIRIIGEYIASIEPISDSEILSKDRYSGQKNHMAHGSISREEAIIDLAGCFVVPGYIDIHVHGGGGADTCDESPDAINNLSAYLAQHGVSSFCATTMTIEEDALMNVLSFADDFHRREPIGSRLLGVHLEGPFLSPVKSGVQSSDVLRLPNILMMEEIESRFPGLIKIIDVAPELPGADEFIQAFSDTYVISLSHSDADYDTTRRAIDRGLRHATHLYNAMCPIHHKSPGPVCAILENQSVTAELICDLIHIHPSLLALTINCLAPDRAVIISDAMRGAGMPDGEYKLGKAVVQVKNGKTDFGDGRLAGSVSSVAEGVRNLVSIGIPIENAIRAATINPARVLGIDQETGSLSQGKLADITVLNQDLIPVMTISMGRVIFCQMPDSSYDKGGEENHD
ncbi:MAG: N-acetylglucosamine-6-phosphate deacetylase [Clostridiaceae bacterium]|nr:N-acetylglucosamine-6-phosphate deacetylase [Clostridiaceae bacterium]